MRIRPLRVDEWPWLLSEADELGGPIVVSFGRLRRLADYPAIVACEGAARRAFLVYIVEGRRCELLALRALAEGGGFAAALCLDLERIARAAGCARIELCTTNDNARALRFYQRLGYRLTHVEIGGFADVMRRKGLDPNVERRGYDGIVLRDVLQLEKRWA